MAGMIAQLLAWPTLGVALLVFGFAPGIVLRLIVLFYRRDNPRRRELLGEIYAVPRIERPFWVAEQLEVALFDGLRDRFKRRKGAQSNAAEEAPASQSTTTFNLFGLVGVIGFACWAAGTVGAITLAVTHTWSMGPWATISTGAIATGVLTIIGVDTFVKKFDGVLLVVRREQTRDHNGET